MLNFLLYVIITSVLFVVHIRQLWRHWHGAHGSLAYWQVVVAQQIDAFAFGTAILVLVSAPSTLSLK
jgi:hypothetical protein